MRQAHASRQLLLDNLLPGIEYDRVLVMLVRL
jgi:hypothetical protein